LLFWVSQNNTNNTWQPAGNPPKNVKPKPIVHNVDGIEVPILPIEKFPNINHLLRSNQFRSLTNLNDNRRPHGIAYTAIELVLNGVSSLTLVRNLFGSKADYDWTP
jgi:hypothetical protein